MSGSFAAGQAAGESGGENRGMLPDKFLTIPDRLFSRLRPLLRTNSLGSVSDAHGFTIR